VFQALSLGKIGQPPMSGLPANASPPGAPPGAASSPPPRAGVLTVTRRAFAQRLRRHGRTE
jgi:hypothetical protein